MSRVWRDSQKMVGTTGFEPATSPTPRVRDTRLRYVPTELRRSGLYSFIRLSLAFEERQESAEGISQVQQHLAAQELSGSIGRAASRARAAGYRCAVVVARAVLLAQMAPRAGNRKTFVIKEALDSQHHLDIFLAVKP